MVTANADSNFGETNSIWRNEFLKTKICSSESYDELFHHRSAFARSHERVFFRPSLSIETRKTLVHEAFALRTHAEK